MGKYETLFKNLRQKNEGAFVPFAVIGDPNMELSFEIIESMIKGGADALELGIPFSDPVADGPVIQKATQRALSAGATPQKCFELIEKLTERYPEMPVGLLVYANLVVKDGLDNFYARAAQSGVDSVLVADVPVYEAPPFFRSGQNHGVDTVLIVPPRASEPTIRGIARISQGYTYVLARRGVTGDGQSLSPQNSEVFDRLEALGAPPALVGFGISRPEHVRETLAAGAAGAISGSAIVRIVENHLSEPEVMCQEISRFVSAMKGATRP